ncbi:MAG: hypothetical protein II347_05135 [Lachnospiraceae bacterium]|nr:hypothetical protein [Lachnospiraceae bacterium]
MSVPWYLMAKGKGGGYKTASGPIVSINDALAAPLRALTLFIDPVQDLHGYESPWPAGGGENLLDPGTDGTIYGVTKRVNSDGTVTFSGTATSVADFYFNGTTPSYTAYLLPNGTYHIEGSEGGSASTYDFFWIYQEDGATKYANGRDHTPVTVDGESTSRIFFRVYSGYTINMTVKLGLFNGAYQANAWSPYSNICPISGRTSATVTRTGRNLLKLAESEMVSTGWNRRFPISLKAGTYIISCQNQFGASTKGALVNLTDENDATIKELTRGYTFGDITFVGTAVTITEEEAKTIKNIQFALRAAGTTYNDIAQADIQLELGSTATAYEPYSGNQYTLQLGQTVYGATLDVTNGVLTVDGVADTFTKDSVWYGFSTGAGNASAVVQLSQYQNCKFVDGSASYNGAISSTGKEAANYWVSARQSEVPNEGDMCFAYSQSGQLRFHRLDVSNITDLESFKAAFPDTVVCYELATPITIPLTPQEISTLQGQNNVWADSGDVTVEYLSSGGTDPDLMKLAVAFMGKR